MFIYTKRSAWPAAVEISCSVRVQESCEIKGFPCDLQVLSRENSGDQQQHIDFLVQQ